jgi:hypothetical protein
MQLYTAKQEALDVIQKLPDTVDFEEIVYRLYVINKIHQGMQDVEQGKGISSEEMLHEIEQW